MNLQTLDSDQLLEIIGETYLKKRFLAIVGLGFGVVVGIGCFFLLSFFSLLIALPIILTAVICILLLNKKLKHLRMRPIFRKYGTPENVAALVRSGTDSIIFFNDNIAVTSTYILNLRNFECFALISRTLLAYYSVKGSEHCINLHDAYGDTFTFPVEKTGNGQTVVDILQQIQTVAPWIKTSLSEENLMYAQKYRIAVGTSPIGSSPLPGDSAVNDPELLHPSSEAPLNFSLEGFSPAVPVGHAPVIPAVSPPPLPKTPTLPPPEPPVPPPVRTGPSGLKRSGDEPVPKLKNTVAAKTEKPVSAKPTGLAMSPKLKGSLPAMHPDDQNSPWKKVKDDDEW